MELKIYWTDFSKKELQKIFEYYKVKASLKVAKNFTIGIAKETLKLKKQPEIGQIEELLIDRPNQFRYLVYKNYKIIYWINTSENRIEISDVFDSRQNPVKIKRT
ncbi:type II toxin-antitoxin system RelE/ParE family toxin [Flavobacterium sp. NG2]|uniref:type II toxin-antitoxin system RelE/ParE family toxin n=1 Tax=Flavobacterium sp. NG2 TaxID=3097547 RepID=UPI002A828016|nr:type II toxin-antitoxin system RelE/ParE family toxin [Flavobacterium sp. NG2]WPR70954.1 type II toxin-antitoxin system RelE/ParE family toxin [Flavobacterium sp. NG2]